MNEIKVNDMSMDELHKIIELAELEIKTRNNAKRHEFFNRLSGLFKEAYREFNIDEICLDTEGIVSLDCILDGFLQELDI